MEELVGRQAQRVDTDATAGMTTARDLAAALEGDPRRRCGGQQTSASTQQIAASARALAGEARRLEVLVGQFTLS